MNNSRKNILALASWYPSRIFLDNGDFIQRHLRSISTLNNVTLVHAVKDENLKSNFEIDDSINQNVREIIVYFKPSFFRPFNLIKQFIAFLKGVSLVNNFDIIHLNVIYPAGLVALFLKNKYKKPIVLTEHWTGFSPERFISFPFYKKFLIKKILRKVDVLTPVSNDLAQKILEIYPITNVKIIPNVVDVELFSVKEDCKIKRITFLHLSHLENEHKNILGMLNVVKKLVDNGYDFEFQIGGNGDLTLINNFVEENNLSAFVKSFGRLQHFEVNQKMKNVNCFVLFSNYENQPCVQIEAFASGIPVIASDVGGIKEFMPNNFGFIVNKNDESALYKAMVEVIEGYEFATPKELNNYVLNNFSKEEIAQQFDDVYTKVLE